MLFILIGIFALVSVTMLFLDLKTGWNGESYATRNTVVFEGRNVEYGAYELRTNYNKRVMLILLSVFLFALLLFGVKTFMDRPKTDELKETLKVLARPEGVGKCRSVKSRAGPGAASPAR